MGIEAEKQRLIGLRAEPIVAQEELRESTQRVETLEGQINTINEEMRDKK